MSNTEAEEETHVEELDPCELGTKEHWDSAYKEELKNYTSNGVVGDVWFGEDICLKIVRYLQKQLEQGKIQCDSSIVDLGTGNGFTLLELFEEGFTNLTGVDYSENAIEMCKAIAKNREADAIKFEVFDLVDGPVDNLGKFEVCLDKGTYDAISLIPDRAQLEVRRKYLENVHKILSEDGIFILTSCNWTTDELKVHSREWFSFVSVIPTATFNFGGMTGNVISIAVLKKGVQL